MLILERLDQNTIRAFHALSNDPNFVQVVDWMKHNLQTIETANRAAKDEVLTRWNQGSAQALSDFIHAAEESWRR